MGAVILFELSLTSVSGKSIRQRNPRKLALGPGMILWLQRFRIIQTSQRYVDGAGQVDALIGQGGSTMTAERANDVCRRRVGGRLARNEREFIYIKSGPRNKWRAACAPASFAMAMGNPVCLPGCAVANRAAKTSTFCGFHDHPPAGTRTIFPEQPVWVRLSNGVFRLRYPIGSRVYCMIL